MTAQPAEAKSAEAVARGRADIREQIAHLQAEAVRLQRQLDEGSCEELGHDWRFIGGCNASCELERSCGCSVPVHECQRCGDCDYGDNAEASEIRERCKSDA